MTSDRSEVVIYQTEDGQTKLDVRMESETVWLTQVWMSEDVSRTERGDR